MVIPLILILFISSCGNNIGTIEFTLSMDQPGTHYFNVKMECKDVNDEYLEVKLPVWTPGYYWIMNYPKNVVNFASADSEGNQLEWEKTTKNSWKIRTDDNSNVVITYDIYAHNVSVADPFLDYGRAFICPTAVFMHIKGMLDHPVSVNIDPYKGWSQISTGLDPVTGETNRFSAPDFDVLYDCPILVGNQEVLYFEVKGIPHYVAMENPGNTNREKFVTDLKKIVEKSAELIGDIPYKHYTFIIMDQGMGGLEHANSMAVYSRGDIYNTNSPRSNTGWLNFITHEFFHLYNVKSIRPVALGPFDYDRENYTNMLWVSEGLTVYYEYLIMNRAGLLSRQEVLDYLSRTIRSYENIPGSKFQSATSSSFDTWINFFNRSSNSSNTTISYYDKGCALGLLLDLAIRHESGNKKSLDDVMRALYFDYYKYKERGFTDEEFRIECERAAGSSLDEIFEVYSSTTGKIDYARYLEYSGLTIDPEPEELPGAFLGASARNVNGDLAINGIEWGSPAWRAGLSDRDQILFIDGEPPGSGTLEEILNSKKPGDSLVFRIKQRYFEREVEVVLGTRNAVSYSITSLAEPDKLQETILNSWIKE